MPGIGSIFFDICLAISFLLAVRVAFVRKKVNPAVLIAVVSVSALFMYILDYAQKQEASSIVFYVVLYMGMAVMETIAIALPVITVDGAFPVKVLFSFIISLVTTAVATLLVMPFDEAYEVLAAEMTARNGSGWAYAYVCSCQIVACLLVARLMRPLSRRNWKRMKIVWGIVIVMLFLEVTGAAMKGYVNYKLHHEDEGVSQWDMLSIVLSYVVITLILVVAGGALFNLSRYMNERKKHKKINKYSVLEGRIMEELIREENSAILDRLRALVEAKGGVLETIGFESSGEPVKTGADQEIIEAVEALSKALSEIERLRYVSLRIKLLEDAALLLCDVEIDVPADMSVDEAWRSFENALKSVDGAWKQTREQGAANATLTRVVSNIV